MYEPTSFFFVLYVESKSKDTLLANMATAAIRTGLLKGKGKKKGKEKEKEKANYKN